MADTNDKTDAPDITGPWRRSSFTNDQCVEVAETADGHVVVRNSRAHSEGLLRFTRAELRAFIDGAKAGEFDDLAD